MRPCCDPPGGGWADRTAQRSQRSGEPGSEKNLLREEGAQRRGNCFRWKVAGMKPKAQPRPRQDSRQTRTYWCRPSPKGGMANSAPPNDGCTGMPPSGIDMPDPMARPATGMRPVAYNGASHGGYRKKTGEAGRQRDTFMRRPSLCPGMEPPPSKKASTSCSGRPANHCVAAGLTLQAMAVHGMAVAHRAAGIVRRHALKASAAPRARKHLH